MRLPLLLLLLLLATVAHAQTITTTNSAGQPIVEFVTSDGQGNTLSQILQTLTTSSTPTTTSTTTSTTPIPDGQQGPVGSPAPTTGTPGGPTPYTYTTTNAAGQTIRVTDTFTPTFPATVLPSVTLSGTILQYSQWLSMVGSPTGTGTAGMKSGAENRCGINIGLIAVFGISIVGGILVLL